jgi:dethiobiotin synthetase
MTSSYPQSLFVSGTDTGVGKTVATTLLALRLRLAGVDAGVMKPFASGCAHGAHGLESEDAVWLRAMTGVDDDLDLINPIRLEEPLAPIVAAERAGEETAGWWPRVRAAYDELQRRHDCVLVEGVGGLLAPIMRAERDYFTCADLAGAFGLPVVVVARRVLGTINHTVLTCRYPLPAPSHFAGLVFCDAAPVAPEDVAAQTSPALIAAMTGLPIWGSVPYAQELSRREMETLSRGIDPFRHARAADAPQYSDRL